MTGPQFSVEAGLSESMRIALLKRQSEAEQIQRTGVIGTLDEPTWAGQWLAMSKDRVMEKGVLYVNLREYPEQDYAKNVVAEVLWGRGYMGDYIITMHHPYAVRPEGANPILNEGANPG